MARDGLPQSMRNYGESTVSEEENMSDELESRRLEMKKQLVGAQLREILQADDSLARRSACDRILDKAGSVSTDVVLLLVQLRVLAEATGRAELSNRIKQLNSDVDLEMLAMETVFDGFPDDWSDDD